MTARRKLPPDRLTWETIHDPHDRRRVVYWRANVGGVAVGAVSRIDGAHRASGYPKGFGRGSAAVVSLGLHSTRGAAAAAVTEFAREHHGATT